MARSLTRALLLLLPLLATSPASAAEPAGSSPGHDLGCAVAKAAGVDSACAELILFRHEPEQRIGEELAQMLDTPQHGRALQALDAELAERKKAPGAGKDCPPARPLCAFGDAALAAMKTGLGPAPSK